MYATIRRIGDLNTIQQDTDKAMASLRIDDHATYYRCLTVSSPGHALFTHESVLTGIETRKLLRAQMERSMDGVWQDDPGVSTIAWASTGETSDRKSVCDAYLKVC